MAQFKLIHHIAVNRYLIHDSRYMVSRRKADITNWEEVPTCWFDLPVLKFILCSLKGYLQLDHITLSCLQVTRLNPLAHMA